MRMRSTLYLTPRAFETIASDDDELIRSVDITILDNSELSNATDTPVGVSTSRYPTRIRHPPSRYLFVVSTGMDPIDNPSLKQAMVSAEGGDRSRY